ncbi:MAG: DUF177 domain-containing protein [Desulfuromonadales bacterium]|nr:DUF177 domain-containing protein [Desulfuromonadales bacterium]
MKIRLDKLKKAAQRVVIDEPVTFFPGLLAAAEQSGVTVTTPVVGELQAVWAGDLIAVSGTLRTVVEGSCSRCLEPVRLPCTVAIELSYAPGRREPVGTESAERELDAEEMGLLPVEGDEIDLLPEIEQDLVMALPQQLLCATECAGLCPVCGTNRNQAACQCEKPVFHSGLAALKNFQIKE